MWLLPQYAKARPRTAPPIASRNDSASEPLISRQRLAPSAARTLSSRPRQCDLGQIHTSEQKQESNISQKDIQRPHELIAQIRDAARGRLDLNAAREEGIMFRLVIRRRRLANQRPDRLQPRPCLRGIDAIPEPSDNGAAMPEVFSVKGTVASAAFSRIRPGKDFGRTPMIV